MTSFYGLGEPIPDVEAGHLDNSADGLDTSLTAIVARQASQTALVLDPTVAITLNKTSSIQDANGNGAIDRDEKLAYTLKAYQHRQRGYLRSKHDSLGTLSAGQTITCTGWIVRRDPG